MTTSISTRRILILGRRNSGKLSLVKSLTSTLPAGLTHEDTPHAGLTHSIALKTRYYSTEAGIWIDEIPEDSETWLNEYLSEEATPVLQSLAAIILTVNPGVEDYRADLEVLQKLDERGEEVEWDGTGFVVGKNTSTVSNLELVAQCDEATFEYVDMNKSGTNEFGEKLGSERVLEILHTCDWTIPADTDSFGSLQVSEIDFELNALGEDEEAKENGSEKDVEYMERMMTMLLNAREMGKEMNLEERKKFARRTVEAVAKMS